VLKGDDSNEGVNSTAISILLVPGDKALNSPSAVLEMTPSNHDALVESMGLICDVIVVAFRQTTNDWSFLHSLTNGVKRRAASGLGKGRMIVASPLAAKSTWVQQQVMSQRFAIITPQHWQMFEFHKPSRLAAVIPNNFLDGQPTMKIVFEETTELDEQIQLVSGLIQKTEQVLNPGSDVVVEHISINAAIKPPFQGMLGLDDNPVNELNEKEVAMAEFHYGVAVLAQNDPNDEIQKVLHVAQQNLESLENKMEEVVLQQSSGNTMPLLEFGSLAHDIAQRAEAKFRAMEEAGQLSPSLYKGLNNGIAKQIQRLYKDQLQSLRNYYGQRYEAILKDDTVEEAEKEWQIAAAAQHMTQGFQAAAQNAIPEIYKASGEFEHRDVLNGLLSDMLEATERLKDNKTLTSMALDDDEGLETESGKTKRRSFKVPNWLERIAARAFVFGVNYLQGWLAWQGIKRAAMERDREQPKFPLF
jgi:hypothetical protein